MHLHIRAWAAAAGAIAWTAACAAIAAGPSAPAPSTAKPVLCAMVATSPTAAPPPTAAPRLAAAPPPTAPPPPTAAQAATVSVLGIRATKEEKPHADPGLESLANALRVGKYNCFRLVVSDTRSVAVGSATDVGMVEDYALRIQVEKLADDEAQIVCTWMRLEKDAKGKPSPRTLQPSRMTIARGKYVLSGGWELKDGAALFAAVAVK